MADNGRFQSKHGMARTRVYRLWAQMHYRCKKHEAYHGVFVCAEWKSFERFLCWATVSGYSDLLEIDRIKNDQGYSPENCRWVTRRGNVNNRRNTIWLSAFGETKAAGDWARDQRCVVSNKTLSRRVKDLGWKTEMAIVTPARNG